MLLNKERAIAKMEEFGLDAIIASRPENVTYLSDHASHSIYMYRFLGAQDYALLPRDENIAPALLTSTHGVPWVVERPSWMEDIRTYGPRRFALLEGVELDESERRYKEIRENATSNSPSRGEALVKALKDKGLHTGTIGIEEQYIDPEVKERLHTELPQAKFVDAFELFRIIRMVKTPEEIERLRTAAEINERAMEAVVGCLELGVAEEDIGQVFLEATAKQGAVFEFWNTTSGRHSAFSLMREGHFFPPSRYRLKAGELIRFDGGSIYNKYHSDTGTCAVFGNPTERMLTVYRAIEAAIEAGMEKVRPGVKPSELYETIAQTGEKMGLKDYRYGRAGYGHGIGIEPRDYPLIDPPRKATSPFLPGSYDLPLEENMVMCIETGYQEVGLGGTQIEHTVVVTKTGCEKITRQDRKLHVV